MANHYQQVRGIPERNMFPYDWSAGLSKGAAWTMVYAIRKALADRGIAGQFQGIALIGPNPSSGSQTSGQYNATSLQSFLFLSPNYTATFDTKTPPAFVSSNYPTSVYTAQPVSYREPPLQPSATLAANIPISGKTYWPISCVGHTGRGGNTLRDVLAYIDRAKSHDGAKPDGTVYWCLSSDIYRTPPREGELAEVVPVWKHLGLRYSVTKSSWISGRPDIVGGIVGEEAVTPDSGGNRFLAGAWADHLTSYGGTLDSYPSASGNGGQMIISSWLRAGADGSSGTFSEPANDAGKFTHGHIHSHFRVGCSLAEAFWQSIRTPAEIVALGDPLVQPYADFPQVAITSPSQNAVVSGTVAIAVTAQATGGKTLEANKDLFVDGRRIAIGNAGETVVATRVAGGFSLGTTTLSDGWHELRVAAYNGDAVRTQSETAVGVVVNNHGQSLIVTGPSAVDIDGVANFTVAVTGSPAVTAIDLKMNGRVLGTLPGTGGTIQINGQKFPLSGAGSLYAVGKLSNGQEMLSAPFAVNPNWVARPAVAAPVFGSSFATIRYFSGTKTTGFDWDTTAPTATIAFAGDATDGLKLNAAALTGVTISSYASATRPGVEAVMLFYAPSDDWYEFSSSLSSSSDLTLAGIKVSGKDASLETVQHLAAGWHRLQIRYYLAASSWAFKIYQRGGANNYYAVIPLSRGASEADAATAGATPQIVSATASSATVTGTTVQLNAVATNPSGSESALIYSWSLLTGPGAPTFSPNGTNAAKVATATFTRAGSYVLGLQVRNGTASSPLSTVTVDVQQTATKVSIYGPVASGNSNVIAGYPLDLVAALVDQFSQPMPSQPAMTWTTTAPGGSVTVGTAGHAIFRSAATTGTYTATATDSTNSARKATWSNIKVTANTAPIITSMTVARNVGTQPIDLRMNASDADDPDSIYLTYKWTITSAPAGQSIAIADDYFPITTGMPTGPGTYVLTASVTDDAGAADVQTVTIHIASNGTLTSSPVMGTQTASPTVLIGDTATLSTSVTGGGLAYQWQFSTGAGSPWQNITGATSSSLVIGPVTLADDGSRYRLIATNSDGSSTGQPIVITVGNPAGGVVRIVGGKAWESDGSAVFTVQRFGGTAGALTAGYMIGSTGQFPAAAGSDYTLPGGVTTGTVTWADGDGADKQIVIPIVNDTVKEPASEQFYIILNSLTSTPDNTANLSSSSKYDYFYILDDDGAGTAVFSASSSTIREDQGSVVLTVQRRHGTSGTLTVSYGIAAGVSTATAGEDFTAVSGSLTWASGVTVDKQITISILRDALPENQETFRVQVQDAAGNIDYAQVSIDDVATTAFQVWQDHWWPGVTNAAIVGDAADPDKDGNSNLLEYATGSNPTSILSTAALPIAQVAGDRLKITFLRAKQASDVLYQVEGSDDLVSWSEVWTSLGVAYGGGSSPTETLTVTDTQSLAGSGGKRFLRLRVSR